MFRIGFCVIALGWLCIFFSIFAAILVDRHSSHARFWGWPTVVLAVGAVMVISGAAMLGMTTRRYQTLVPEKEPHPISRERKRAIGSIIFGWCFGVVSVVAVVTTLTQHGRVPLWHQWFGFVAFRGIVVGFVVSRIQRRRTGGHRGWHYPTEEPGGS